MSDDKLVREIFSRNIKKFREVKGKSLRDLENEVGIAYSTLANYERGIREPSFDTIVKLADYFNVSMDDMFGRGIAQQEDIRIMTDNLPEHIKPDFSLLVGELGELVRREDSAEYERNCLQFYYTIFSYLNELEMLAGNKLSELKKTYPDFDITDPYKIAREAHKDLLTAVSTDGKVEEFIDRYHGSINDISSAAYEMADKVYKIITLHLVNELIGKKEKGAD